MQSQGSQDPVTPCLIKYPSTGQFRHVVRDCRAQGIDELTFTGTVKLHGTNSGVVFSCKSGNPQLWAQSRNRVLTPEKDNQGFATFVKERETAFIILLQSFAKERSIDLEKNFLCVYGEWCGNKIQKYVAIEKLPRMFVIFAACCVPISSVKDESTFFWFDVSSGERPQRPEERIFNIYDFSNFQININFGKDPKHPNSPANSKIELERLTAIVENDCPVARQLLQTIDSSCNGADAAADTEAACTTGEGIVWSCIKDGQLINFKVKGEQHNVVRPKDGAASICPEKMRSIQEFIHYAVTQNRLEQGIEVLFTSEGTEATDKDCGKFIKWVKGDVLKEESDTMAANKLKPRDVIKHIMDKARVWFQSHLDQQIFG
jgi:hypothetical protein